MDNIVHNAKIRTKQSNLLYLYFDKNEELLKLDKKKGMEHVLVIIIRRKDQGVQM